MKQVDYLIVGGGLSSAHAVQAIRKNDNVGSILLISEEKHILYDRVPLSKNYLFGKMKREVLFVKKMDFYQDQKIELMMDHKATELDVQRHMLKTDDGTVILFKKTFTCNGGTTQEIRYSRFRIERCLLSSYY